MVAGPTAAAWQVQCTAHCRCALCVVPLVTGTLFLWMMWPSFNAVLASPSGKFLAITNTLLALVSGAMVTFLISSALSSTGKLDMVHIQNSTLAGGVAMGAAADLNIHPAGALGLGAAVAVVSVLGYKKLTPYLQDKFDLQDTCGVHNLHGMPGLIAGIASFFVIIGNDGVTPESWRQVSTALCDGPNSLYRSTLLDAVPAALVVRVRVRVHACARSCTCCCTRW